MERHPAERFTYHSASVGLATLDDEDRVILSEVYRFLQQLLARLETLRADDANACEELTRFVATLNYQDTFQSLETLGRGDRLAMLPAETAKAFHDVRSGSLTAIALVLDLFRLGMAKDQHIDRLYLLCRDHLKIMRNCVIDLDLDGFEHDLTVSPHSVELLREKWGSVHYSIPGATATVDFESEFEGVVSSCCMEFAALDRALYNLINNATRFSADGRVRVSVDAMSPSGETDLRFSVHNAVSDSDAAKLRQLLQEQESELSELFAGGITVDGNGLGLSICADLVCHNYTLEHTADALGADLLGVELARTGFTVWFSAPGEWRAQAAA